MKLREPSISPRPLSVGAGIKPEAETYTNRRIENIRGTDPCRGIVKWSAGKSLWLTGMTAGWLTVGTVFFAWDAVLLFLASSAITLCGGHSLGMHRKLIHDSYACPDWLEKIGVYLGTLVGLGGPFTMMYTHDMRDWAQRQSRCHDFFSHRQSMLVDGWWQLHCKLHLDQPPVFRFPTRLTESRFYTFIERTAMWQQLPWAILFFFIGGWGWVAWGVCGRVSVSIMGHWLIGYFAHNRGHQDWRVEGACVQGYNVRFCGLLTFGECWHNNHHAFPNSAQIGLYRGQADPGWWMLKCLEKLELISDLKQPRDLPMRPELTSM